MADDLFEDELAAAEAADEQARRRRKASALSAVRDKARGILQEQRVGIRIATQVGPELIHKAEALLEDVEETEQLIASMRENDKVAAHEVYNDMREDLVGAAIEVVQQAMLLRKERDLGRVEAVLASSSPEKFDPSLADKRTRLKILSALQYGRPEWEIDVNREQAMRRQREIMATDAIDDVASRESRGFGR